MIKPTPRSACSPAATVERAQYYLLLSELMSCCWISEILVGRVLPASFAARQSRCDEWSFAMAAQFQLVRESLLAPNPSGILSQQPSQFFFATLRLCANQCGLPPCSL